MISVLVVDDQALIRGALVDMLSHEPGIVIVGQAENGFEAVTAALALRPDVVLMDIRMPGMDGIAATEEIVAADSLAQTRVLILTTFEDEESVITALRAGASGFVGKGIEPRALLDAVRAVHAGEAMLSPKATRTVVSRLVSPAPQRAHDPRADVLTRREREVVKLVGLGLTNDAIAQRLSIAPATAKTHVNRSMTKLAVHDRGQLVAAAHRLRLL